MKMKNKLKKVVAYVLSFMMLFTMSAMNIGSVSAASTGSITLNVAQHDIGATTFSVYKLMDATSANDKIAYTVNSDFKEFFKQTDVANSEDDEVVYGDSGYLGIQKRPEVAGDDHLSGIDYRINRRPGKLPHVSDNAIDWERYIENRKSSVRCKVEHAFRIIKCQFGYRKTVYRGLAKNENRLYAMFACANLYALAIAGQKLSTT